MIRQPSEYNGKNKRFRALIAGYPGIGKTTLALSAPNPLHIDVDKGFDRVEVRFRKPYIQPSNYEEILEDLKPENLTAFDTLVFDTGGQLIEYMKPYVIKQNPKNGQRDGSPSLSGYSAVSKEFKRLMDHCFYTLNKHVIVLFHAKEEKDGDNTKLRLLVEGSTRDNVWQPMDIGGFMEMQGSIRTIGFSNCERYFAKGVHGIKGVMKIPDTSSSSNDFVTNLFKLMEQNIDKESSEAKQMNEAFDAIMSRIGGQIKTMNPANIEDVQSQIVNAQHVLTSQQELKAMFKARLAEIGYRFDAERRAYVPDDSIPA